MFRRLLLTAFAFFLAVPFFVSAQEAVAPAEPPAFLKDVQSKADFDRLTPEQQQEANAFIKGNSAGPSLAGKTVAPLSGTANCFDYYTFGSVQVDISPALEQTLPGIPMTFTGELKNENPYPVVSGSVYVKIFKLSGSDEEGTHRNGHPLVAFFEAGENIQIPASGTVPFTFEWQVPSALSGGDYEAAYFFVTNDRFNLLGLSFTDDVTGNKATFRVTDTNNQQVVFDKNTVTLNDKPYSFAAFPPRFKPDEPVKLETTLVNPSNTDKTVTLAWKLYNWDGLRDDHLLDIVEEIVTIKPKERKQLVYTAKRYTGAVSYMIVTAQDGDATSVINPRFAREGVEEVRLNFPSFFTYPLEAGKEATIFSCLHSTNLPIVENNTLTMTLADADTGEKLHEYSYQGGITGAMMGVKDVFTPTYVPRRVMLTSTLTHNGVTVDTVSQTYDCAVLSPENCQQKNNGISAVDAASEKPAASIAAVLLLIILGSAVFFYVRRKRGKDSIVLGLLISLAVFGAFGVSSAEAKSVTWSSAPFSGTYGLAYFWNYSPAYATDTVPLTTSTPSGLDWYGWLPGISPGAIASVTYRATLIDDNTSLLISDFASIPVGTKFRVQATPHVNTDISWFGTGESFDSPYGNWVSEAGPLPYACRPEFYVNEAPTANFNIDVYILANFNPPTAVIDSPSSNLSCAGGICTVIAPGPVSVGLRFSSTYGKFYYRYYDYRETIDYFAGSWKGCHANNVPMRTAGGVYDSFFGISIIPPSDFVLSVPSTAITFNLTAVAGNNLPNVPTLTHGAVCNAGQSYVLSAQGTDPDGDQVYYEFDINNDGVADGRTPGAGFVNSGTLSSLTVTPTAGVYQVRARTVDAKGGRSNWSVAQAVSCAVVPPAPTVTFTANPTSIVAGNSSLLSWTTSNAQSCWLSGGGIDSWTTLPNGNRNVSPAVTTTYSLQCWNASGVSSGVQSRTVTVTAPIPPQPASISGSCPSPGTVANLSWSPSSGATYYQLRVDNTTANPWSGTCSSINPGDVCNNFIAGTAYSINPSSPGAAYNAWVHACNASGCSPGAASAGFSCVAAAAPAPAPTFTFTANPTSIVAGNSSLLSWTTSNAQSCWLSGGGIGSWAALPTGNRSVSPAVTTTYSLECWNASGVSSGVQSRTVTVTAPTYSCTGTIPANASMFANDNVGLSVNTPYTYWPTDTGTRCQYSCNGGYNWNGSACVPPVSTLKVCLNSCNSGSNNFNGQTVDLAPNDTRRYVACYNAASGCNAASGDITADASTTFSATDTPSDAVNPTATKGEFRANAVPVTRSESVSVGTSQGSASVTLRVTPICVSGCSAQAGDHCQGETFTTTNSCGASETCTNAGTRYCDFNWKEVAPGN